MELRDAALRILKAVRNLCAIAAVTIAGLSFARAQSVDDRALDFLIQKVCVDRTGNVLPVDPYDCPASDTLRSLKIGEALPYHKHDYAPTPLARSLQRHDSYPVLARDGGTLVANPFDYAPFGQFDSARDGYDVTVIREGWASISETRTQEGLTTWFGAHCKPYNGWILFPVSALRGEDMLPGETKMPIRGVDLPAHKPDWPGACPFFYEPGAITRWEWAPKFAFGGVGGATLKSIDTIRIIHGDIDGWLWHRTNHLEIFYLTRLYGLTRWESWATERNYQNDPQLQKRAALVSRRCNGPVQHIYKSEIFERTGCRDWTAIDIPTQPEPPPIWPIPDALTANPKPR